jgi:hypothetical protein
MHAQRRTPPSAGSHPDPLHLGHISDAGVSGLMEKLRIAQVSAGHGKKRTENTEFL